MQLREAYVPTVDNWLEIVLGDGNTDFSIKTEKQLIHILTKRHMNLTLRRG